MIKDHPIQEFLDDLASNAPTPGGGSAAAIMGAMGAGLVSMVCNLTIGKEKYKAVEDEMKTVLDQAEALRDHLTDMINTDTEVFDRVMDAYRMPKETGEEQAAREEEIQAALKAATEVPLDCARAGAEVIKLSRFAAENGNSNVISDAGVAVLAGYATVKSAALNVYVNIGAMDDPAFAQTAKQELFSILDGCGYTTEEIYQLVKGQL